MQKALVVRLYVHFSSEAKRPHVDDRSLQFIDLDSEEVAFNVKQLYNSFKLKSSFVSDEYEASLQNMHSLEQELVALKEVAKDLEEAYQVVIKMN